MRKLFDFAALYQIKSGMHGPTDISPVGMAAALHLDLAIHNFGIQEYMPHSARTRGVPARRYTFADGCCTPATSPASASTVDEAAARSRTGPPTCR